MSEANPIRSGIKAGEIVANRVSKSYGAVQFSKEVVRDCSFTVERGKLTVMIGPSGCGKSTLIRLLAGFEKPTSGTITLNGEPVAGPEETTAALPPPVHAMKRAALRSHSDICARHGMRKVMVMRGKWKAWRCRR